MVKTDLNVSTLAKIERIQSLLGENRRQYTAVIGAIRTKVLKLQRSVCSYLKLIKHLLSPGVFSKFHESFHQFSTTELFSLIDSPESLCGNVYNLWQCIVEKIVEKELETYDSQPRNVNTVKVLDITQQNAVRYTAGSVVRKLIENEKADEEKIDCLTGLLLEAGY
jgi:hypothetical protein